jgi:hypothetical protein
MSRGVTGAFETWKTGIPYACLRGDIEKTAGLAIEEGNTTTVRFKRRQPHPGLQDAVSSGSGRAPAREGEDAGRGSSDDCCRASLSRPSGLTGQWSLIRTKVVWHGERNRTRARWGICWGN